MVLRHRKSSLCKGKEPGSDRFWDRKILRLGTGKVAHILLEEAVDYGAHLAGLGSCSLRCIIIGICDFIIQIIFLFQGIQVPGNRNSGQLRCRELLLLHGIHQRRLILVEHRFYEGDIKFCILNNFWIIRQVAHYILEPVHIRLYICKAILCKLSALHCHHQMLLGPGECHIEQVALLLALEFCILILYPCVIEQGALILHQFSEPCYVIVYDLIVVFIHIVDEVYAAPGASETTFSGVIGYL